MTNTNNQNIPSTGYQSQDIHGHAYLFECIVVLRNNQITQEPWLSYIRKFISDFVPSTKFPDNRTVLVFTQGECVAVYRMDVWYNLVAISRLFAKNEESLTSDITIMTKYLKFVIQTIQPVAAIANEVQFKAALYLPTETKLPRFNVTNKSSSKTILQESLPGTFVEYKYTFKVKDNFELLDEETTTTSSGFFGAVGTAPQQSYYSSPFSQQFGGFGQQPQQSQSQFGFNQQQPQGAQQFGGFGQQQSQPQQGQQQFGGFGQQQQPQPPPVQPSVESQNQFGAKPSSSWSFGASAFAQPNQGQQQQQFGFNQQPFQSSFNFQKK